MDAQSLNILRNSTAEKFKLIDYEYAGFNPRAADIANTFNEYCDMNHLRANYETQYPNDNQQDQFLNAYLETCGCTDGELDLATMKQEIGKHTLMSHLGWAAWSIVQNQISNVEFEYLDYAKLRMEGYEFMKKRYFSHSSNDS